MQRDFTPVHIRLNPYQGQATQLWNRLDKTVKEGRLVETQNIMNAIDRYIGGAETDFLISKKK